MKVYLSGPITDTPGYREAFDAADDYLRSLGHEVYNPAAMGDEFGDGPGGWGQYLARDLQCILTAGIEAVAVLEGWQGSRGARLEVHAAVAAGIPILCARTLQPLPVRFVLAMSTEHVSDLAEAPQ